MNIFLEILTVHLTERLRHGGSHLESEVRRARERFSSQEIYNHALLPAVHALVKKYEANEIYLPELLKAAERVEFLQNYLERSAESTLSENEATMGAIRNADSLVVLATVQGDVHKVGIHLAECLLKIHGYNTLNLGENQSIENILELLQKGEVTALAMTGLLNSSVTVMKNNLSVLENHGVSVPVLLGAPALTRQWVEQECQNVYSGKVFYCGNALASLKAVETIQETKRSAEPLTHPRSMECASLTASKPEVLSTAPLTGNAPFSNCNNAVLPFSVAVPSVEPALVSPAPFIPAAPFYGTRIVTEISLQDIFPYMNVRPLFTGHWQFRRGTKTKQAHEDYLTAHVAPLLETWKNRCITERLLAPKVVYGFFPCQALGNELIIYEEDLITERLRFSFPRGGRQNLCLTDFFSAQHTGVMDTLALQIVTVGNIAGETADKFFSEGHYHDYFIYHGLSAEMAEATAEYWHKQIRHMWGIGHADGATPEKILGSQYQGERFSFGYPACPNLEDQALLFQLLQPERIGISLTELSLLVPEQSTSALLLHHPAAHYFEVSTIPSIA